MSKRIEIPIHVTEAQYRTFARDLAILREAGAESNTAAILEQVHRGAVAVKYPDRRPRKRRAASTTPPARQQEVES